MLNFFYWIPVLIMCHFDLELVLKSHTILSQNTAYSHAIDAALDLCKIMIINTSNLYPFAMVSYSNKIKPIFVPSASQLSDEGLIEELEKQLNIYRSRNSNSVGMLVYSATVTSADDEKCDAIVLNITDSNQKSTITIYPYHQKNGIFLLDKPFTCYFSD